MGQLQSGYALLALPHFPPDRSGENDHKTTSVSTLFFSLFCLDNGVHFNTDAPLTAMGNNGERDPNASAVPNGSGCYSLCEGAPFMNYNASINSVTDSFHWGIRWYIAKRSVYDYDISPCTGMVSNMSLLSVTDTLTAYRGNPDDPNYAQKVLDLYNEGKNPHEGPPTYLWPIKTDFCPRQ